MKILSLYFFIFLMGIYFQTSCVNTLQINENDFDVVIVCHYKDYETLPLCIASIKKYIKHKRIFVIGNKELKSDEFIYVPEQNFYQFINPYDMQEIWKKNNKDLSIRAFWIFQQFLKLGAYLLINDLSENYLCIDSDVIWQKPIKFISEEGKFLIPQQKISSDYKSVFKPYKITYAKIMKEQPNFRYYSTFIAHSMIFSRRFVKELLQHIESLHHKKWYDVIFESCNFNEISTFSEYELYGTWISNNYRNEIIYRNFNFLDVKKLDDQYSQKIDFVAMHWYLRNKHNHGYPF